METETTATTDDARIPPTFGERVMAMSPPYRRMILAFLDQFERAEQTERKAAVEQPTT